MSRISVVRVACDCCGKSADSALRARSSYYKVLAADGCTYNTISQINCDGYIEGFVSVPKPSWFGYEILRMCGLHTADSVHVVSDVCVSCWAEQDAFRTVLTLTLPKLAHQARAEARKAERKDKVDWKLVGLLRTLAEVEDSITLLQLAATLHWQQKMENARKQLPINPEASDA